MMETAETTEGSSGANSRRGLVLVAAAALLLWFWATLPLALGQRTLCFRDVFTTHVPFKAFGAAELAHGRIPAFNTTWALGQPFRGNPNALPFYPGNVLYVLLPFWSAFNLHYALHWLLAALTMAALARALGQGPMAALVAGITYAGSGWILSCLSFYNLLAVSAWWPLAMWGVVRGGRQGVAIGGIACGLALLGGEPVTAALGLVPMLLAACQRHGIRRGVGLVFATGATGLLIALPQLVATARVVGFTVRSALGAANSGVFRFHLGPARLLELIVPLPFGTPWNLATNGYWSWDGQPDVPYIVTLHIGIVGLWLALMGARKARSWALLAATGLALAWAGGFGGDLFATLSRGLVRYPEKLLFWFALSAALLAGWGLERVLASPRAWRGAAAGAGLAVATVVGVFLAGPRLAAWLAAGRVVPGVAAEAARSRIGTWIVSLVLAALFLGIAAVAARRGSAPGLGMAQLLSLLTLGGLVMTAPVSEFTPSEWTRRLGPGAGVVSGVSPDPTEPTYQSLIGAAALDLAPAPGVLYGLTYPMAPDLDGLYSPLFLPVRDAKLLNGEALMGLWRALGVRAVVLNQRGESPRLQLVDSRQAPGSAPSLLFAVKDPAPSVWWPRSVTAAPTPVEAVQFLRSAPDLIADAVAARPIAHHPGAQVRLVRETPDEIEVDVSGEGGLLILRRAYQPLYEATASGKPIATLPVNVVQLGVEVPAGAHRVRIAVDSTPEKLAGGIALLTLIAALALAWRP
jgi:hypothetical protein